MHNILQITTMYSSIKNTKTKKVFPQVLAAVAAWMVVMQIGLMAVWSSPYLDQLTAPDSLLPLTFTEASWVASFLNLGIIGGAFVVILIDAFGSKKTTLISAIPMAVGWILIFFANTSVWLYVARFSLGVGHGFAYNSFALYLGEISSPEIRGALVSFAAVGMSMGDFISSVAGAYLDFRTSSLLYVTPCIIAIVMLYLLPDSPHNLIKMNDFEGAKKSIIWYRGGAKIDEDLKEVISFVQATTSNNFMQQLAKFKLGHIRKAIVLVMVLSTFTQLSGVNTVQFYMEITLNQANFNLIEPSTAVFLILAVSVVIGFLTINVYDKFGRRVLMIISCLGISLSHLSLGTHFILLKKGIQWSGSQLLPVISLSTFSIFFTIGLNSIPSIVGSEVFAADIKPIASCLNNIVIATSAFIATKSYQPLVDRFGEAYVLYGHAFVMFVGIPYALIFMPETKGKNLQQVQDDLMEK